MVVIHRILGTFLFLLLLLQVKPVSYVMVNADTELRTHDSKLNTLPLGATVHLSVSFHDDVGDRFFATSGKIKYRANRLDLLQMGYGVDNNTLIAKATNMGQTVLKVR